MNFRDKTQLIITTDLIVTKSVNVIGSVELEALNFVLANGAQLLGLGKGQASATGRGAGQSGASGGSYGGRGGRSNLVPGAPGAPYGDNLKRPRLLGSGGHRDQANGGAGGAAIKIKALNSAIVDGIIDMSGGDGTAYQNLASPSQRGGGGGSGGSVYIESLSFGGAGNIKTNGGNGKAGGCQRTHDSNRRRRYAAATYICLSSNNGYTNGQHSGGGGGGRIAIWSSKTSFVGSLESKGGRFIGTPANTANVGSPGTV